MEDAFQWRTGVDPCSQHHSPNLGKLKGLCSRTLLLQRAWMVAGCPQEQVPTVFHSPSGYQGQTGEAMT